MTREIPRTLQSLTRDYQLDSEKLEYEVLVIDNGSSEALDGDAVRAFGPHFHYHYLDDPPPSPAFAMNYGARQSTGDILCFIIDGAHLLTPGVFKFALACSVLLISLSFPPVIFSSVQGTRTTLFCKGIVKQERMPCWEKSTGPTMVIACMKLARLCREPCPK